MYTFWFAVMVFFAICTMALAAVVGLATSWDKNLMIVLASALAAVFYISNLIIIHKLTREITNGLPSHMHTKKDSFVTNILIGVFSVPVIFFLMFAISSVDFVFMVATGLVLTFLILYLVWKDLLKGKQTGEQIKERLKEVQSPDNGTLPCVK